MSSPFLFTQVSAIPTAGCLRIFLQHTPRVCMEAETRSCLHGAGANRQARVGEDAKAILAKREMKAPKTPGARSRGLVFFL